MATCPACGGGVAGTEIRCPHCGEGFHLDDIPMVSASPEQILLAGCTVLGGIGHALRPGFRADLFFDGQHDTLRIRTLGIEVLLPYIELLAVRVSGPGRVTSGGGFIGGGLGMEGALEGIGIAAILNALTTKTTIHTVLALETIQGEVFLHYGLMEPDALRIVLSPVVTRLRHLDPAWMQAQLSRLTALRDLRVITEQEYQRTDDAVRAFLKGSARS